MRYRPFGRSGAAVSSLALALTDRLKRDDERIRLIYAALEAGMNTFELQTRDGAAATALGQALAAVERQMVFVSIRLGWRGDGAGQRVRDLTPDGLTGAIDAALAKTGLGYLDVAVLSLVDGETMPDHVMPLLHAARADGRVRMLGIAGADSADRWIDGGEFEVLVTAFNIHSGWRERNRLARAQQANMAIIGSDYMPFGRRKEDPPAPMVETGPGRGISRLWGAGREAGSAAPPAKAAGVYDFLQRARGWTAEEVCLGFALTEPSLAAVLTRCSEAKALADLAEVVERELPTGIAAQIEMARFSGGEGRGAA